MQHLRPASLCSRLLLKRRPPNSKGNELVKHRDLGIMAAPSLSLLFFPFSISLSSSSSSLVCVSVSLQYTYSTYYTQRAHIHGVLRMGTERDWNEWKGVKEESTRVLHRAREQRPASPQLLGPHPHHCQCHILGPLLIPSVSNNAKQINKNKQCNLIVSVLSSFRVQGSSMCNFPPNVRSAFALCVVSSPHTHMMCISREVFLFSVNLWGNILKFIWSSR